MRQDELRAPNLSCAAQLFAADAFRAGPSGFSVLPQSGLCARLLPSLLSFGLWRITTCSALISGFLCLLLHLYCSQRSTASHFVTHTRHKVLERVRCVRLSSPPRRRGDRGVAPGVPGPARRQAPGPRDGRAATRVRPPPRLPPYASTK